MTPPSELMGDLLMEPVSSQAEITSASEVVSEPSDDFVDLTNNVTEEAEDNAAAAAQDTAIISLDEPSDDFVDLLGSETEALQEEVVIVDVPADTATDKSEVTGSDPDPPGEGKEEVEEASTAAVMDIIGDSGGESDSNTQPPPGIATFVDPLVDFLSDTPPAAEAKKPSMATIDLFNDEEGSDLFADPLLTTSDYKQPQKSLFGEPDEDLFGEPLGAISKKTVNKEQKDKTVTVKAAAAAVGGINVTGPLHEISPAEAGDLFTEEAVATAPSVSTTSTVNSKTNGVHSEEETDIFAGGSIVSILWLHHLFLCMNVKVWKAQVIMMELTIGTQSCSECNQELGFTYSAKSTYLLWQHYYQKLRLLYSADVLFGLIVSPPLKKQNKLCPHDLCYAAKFVLHRLLVSPQQEGSWFGSRFGHSLSVCSLDVLFLSVWVFCGWSGLFPLSKDMKIGVMSGGDSKSTVGVNGSGQSCDTLGRPLFSPNVSLDWLLYHWEYCVHLLDMVTASPFVGVLQKWSVSMVTVTKEVMCSPAFFFCYQDYAKTTEASFRKFCGAVGGNHRKNALKFVPDLD